MICASFQSLSRNLFSFFIVCGVLLHYFHNIMRDVEEIGTRSKLHVHPRNLLLNAGFCSLSPSSLKFFFLLSWSFTKVIIHISPYVSVIQSELEILVCLSQESYLLLLQFPELLVSFSELRLFNPKSNLSKLDLHLSIWLSNVPEKVKILILESSESVSILNPCLEYLFLDFPPVSAELCEVLFVNCFLWHLSNFDWISY